MFCVYHVVGWYMSLVCKCYDEIIKKMTEE